MARKRKPETEDTLPRGVNYDVKREQHWIQYNDQHGARRREWLPHGATAAKARALYNRRRDDVKRARAFGDVGGGPRPGEQTLLEAMKEYLKEAKATKRSWREDVRFSLVWAQFEYAPGHQLGHLPLSQVRRAFVRDYRQRRLAAGIAPATVNRAVGWLQHVLNEAVGDDQIEFSPLAQLKKLRENNARTRWLNLIEEAQLRKKVADGFWPYVKFAMDTGLRQSEQFRLAWTDVDFVTGLIRVVGKDSRGGQKVRFVPIMPSVAALLRDLPSRMKSPWVFPSNSTQHKHAGQAATYGIVRAAWEQAVKDAALGDLHWHDLRHTFASRAVMAGAGLARVMEWLGHSSMSMMRRYAHLAPDYVADISMVAEKFGGSIAPKQPQSPDTEKEPHNEASQKSGTDRL